MYNTINKGIKYITPNIIDNTVNFKIDYQKYPNSPNYHGYITQFNLTKRPYNHESF